MPSCAYEYWKMLLGNEHHKPNICTFNLPRLLDHTWWALWWRLVKPDLEKERFPCPRLPFYSLWMCWLLCLRTAGAWTIICCELRALLAGLMSQRGWSGLEAVRCRLWKQSGTTFCGPSKIVCSLNYLVGAFSGACWLAVWKLPVFEWLIPQVQLQCLSRWGQSVFFASYLCFSSRLRFWGPFLVPLFLNGNSCCTVLLLHHSLLSVTY